MRIRPRKFLVAICLISFCFCYSCKEKTPADRIVKGLRSSIVEYYNDMDYCSYRECSFLAVYEWDTLDGYRLFRLSDSHHYLRGSNQLSFYRKIKDFKVLFRLKEFNYSDSILKQHTIDFRNGEFYDPNETMVIMNDQFEIVSIIEHTGYMPLDSLKKEYPDKFNFLK